ncbi:hypothetical protein QBC44DRAFT_106151 [Cladorrhinum sp. PSN332]|nr:hypothetical protein QBC44DRAFT_106151 [Cladorrhinum sp. PSN332]
MDHRSIYNGNNLPMPLEGGDLEVATTPKQYYSDTTAGGHYYQPYPGQIPPSSPANNFSSETKEDRILGLKPRTLLLITTSLLILVISAVALVAALLGSKIAKLESNSSSSGSNLPINSGDNSGSSPTTSSSSPPTTTTSSAPATFTTNIAVPGYRYIGCYIDDNDRILPEHEVDGSSSMTNQLCANGCAEAGRYKYFGTESRDQCYCSNTLASDAPRRKANEWNCNQNCAGSDFKKQEICGGNFFVGVWERV